MSQQRTSPTAYDSPNSVLLVRGKLDIRIHAFKCIRKMASVILSQNIGVINIIVILYDFGNGLTAIMLKQPFIKFFLYLFGSLLCKRCSFRVIHLDFVPVFINICFVHNYAAIVQYFFQQIKACKSPLVQTPCSSIPCRFFYAGIPFCLITFLYGPDSGMLYLTYFNFSHAAEKMLRKLTIYIFADQRTTEFERYLPSFFIRRLYVLKRFDISFIFRFINCIGFGFSEFCLDVPGQIFVCCLIPAGHRVFVNVSGKFFDNLGFILAGKFGDALYIYCAFFIERYNERFFRCFNAVHFFGWGDSVLEENITLSSTLLDGRFASLLVSLLRFCIVFERQQEANIGVVSEKLAVLPTVQIAVLFYKVIIQFVKFFP